MWGKTHLSAQRRMYRFLGTFWKVIWQNLLKLKTHINSGSFDNTDSHTLQIYLQKYMKGVCVCKNTHTRKRTETELYAAKD